MKKGIRKRRLRKKLKIMRRKLKAKEGKKYTMPELMEIRKSRKE